MSLIITPIETLFTHIHGDTGTGGRTQHLTDTAFRLYLGMIENCYANGHGFINMDDIGTIYLTMRGIDGETISDEVHDMHAKDLVPLLHEIEENDLSIQAFDKETDELAGFVLPFMAELLEGEER